MRHGWLIGIMGLLLQACDRVTSDRDLVWVDPYKAVETMNEPAGVFQKPRPGAFVDARSPEEYAKARIPGAVSLPFPTMQERAARTLAGYGVLVVYGDDEEGIIAVAGSKRLMELGFKSVYTLQGGLTAWRAAGMEVQRDTAATGSPGSASKSPSEG